MSDQYPLPKSHPGRSTIRWSRPLGALPDGRNEMQAFYGRNPRWAPMLQFYDHLCKAYGTSLYGGVVMGGGVILAGRSDVAFDEDVIKVVFDADKNIFSIAHRNRDVQADHSESCSPNDVLERTRLFIAYKFGIYAKGAKA